LRQLFSPRKNESSKKKKKKDDAVPLNKGGPLNTWEPFSGFLAGAEKVFPIEEKISNKNRT
jgi:hypothetical protein